MHKTKPNETKACFKHLYAIQPGMDRPILQLPGVTQGIQTHVLHLGIMTTRHLAVTHGSLGKCSRLSQPSRLLVCTII